MSQAHYGHLDSNWHASPPEPTLVPTYSTHVTNGRRSRPSERVAAVAARVILDSSSDIRDAVDRTGGLGTLRAGVTGR